MGIDNKYGRVTLEHGSIGEDEPVVVFRARDPHLPKLLGYYLLFCLKGNSPKHHITLILNTRDKIVEWQKNHKTQIPASTTWNERENQ